MSKTGEQRVRGQFTGWHMTGILVCFFGVVMGVNFTMARVATETFGGIVVENSYVASQEFNGWLDRAEAQKNLGWQVVTTWRPDGRLVLTTHGTPGALKAQATARHPLGHMPDQQLQFTALGGGRYLSRQELPAGRWTLRLELSDGMHDWRREEKLS